MLTINGSEFVTASQVKLNGVERVTTFVSANQLTAQVLAGDVASVGVVNVNVLNPPSAGGGGGLSNTLALSITEPSALVPALSNVTPNRVLVGSGAFTLSVTGANFTSNSLVRWNGADRPTTFINAMELTAQIPASDIASLGAQQGAIAITVFNPPSTGGGGGTSNVVGLSLVNPVPVLNNLSPSNAITGSAALTLTVNGSNFVSGASVQWNNSARLTTFVSATQLRAQITADDLLSVRTVNVTVVNPSSPAGGGGVSNAATFTINAAPHPLPVLVSLSPNSASAGSGAFTLMVSGNSFVSGAVIRWNGADRATTFISQTQLSAPIAASDLVNAGNVAVTVFNPASASGGGGLSNSLTFTITPAPNPAPILLSVTPDLIAARSGAFTLTATGRNFLTSSIVRWNGADRVTTFVSATQLTAQIVAGDINAVGNAQVTVVNPPSTGGGGGTSSAQTVMIASPLASTSAASYRANEVARDSIVAAFGANLATGIEVARTNPLPTNLRGTSLSVRDSAGVSRLAPLFFVAPTQVNYLVPAGTATGLATVSLSSGDNKISLGTVTIVDVSPGIFTANATGAGVPSALVLRIKADNTFAYESLSVFNQPTSQWQPAPIDLGPETDQLFLVIFGTGFAYRRGPANGTPANVTATLGGISGNVPFAGAQGGLIGVDQANIAIPRTLKGRGEIDVLMTVDGKATNTVRIVIR